MLLEQAISYIEIQDKLALNKKSIGWHVVRARNGNGFIAIPTELITPTDVVIYSLPTPRKLFLSSDLCIKVKVIRYNAVYYFGAHMKIGKGDSYWIDGDAFMYHCNDDSKVGFNNDEGRRRYKVIAFGKDKTYFRSPLGYSYSHLPEVKLDGKFIHNDVLVIRFTDADNAVYVDNPTTIVSDLTDLHHIEGKKVISKDMYMGNPNNYSAVFKKRTYGVRSFLKGDRIRLNTSSGFIDVSINDVTLSKIGGGVIENKIVKPDRELNTDNGKVKL